MNRTILAATLAACAALVACSDDFLTEVPADFVSPANFYNNAGDALAATNAAYATFVSLPSPLSNDGYYGRNFWMVVEYPTEYVTNRLSAGNERSFFDGYSPLMTSTHAYLSTIWQSAYAGINRANSVVDRVPAVEMDTTLRKRLVGEAKFLRALHYYNLAGLFGGVPIRLSETVGLGELQTERATADSTYRVIFKDLEDAILVLPERSKYATTDYGRATKGAAKTLLAKAHMQAAATGVPAGSYARAATLLREVIASNEYALDGNYGSLFDGTNEQSKEIIFSLQHIRVEGAGGRLNQWFAPAPRTGTPIVPGALTHFSVEWPFLQSYAATDIRRDATWLMSFQQDGKTVTFPLVLPTASADRTNLNNAYGGQSGGPTARKYIDFGAAEGAEGIDYIVLRYADVLLMLAEAVSAQGSVTQEALDAVNAVRTRARVSNLATGLAAPAFRDSVFVQRRFELAIEGHGVFDNRRNWEWAKRRVEAHMALSGSTGIGINRTTFTSLVPKVTLPVTPIADKWKLYPIPNRAIELNPKLATQQNPGW
jgi:starch-binding outer membrane protein, SusD/RagB family